MEPVFSATVAAGDRAFALSVTEEDVTQVYPGLFRYTVSAAEAGSTVALFRTNTYEYAPGVPLHAKEVALSKAGEWERDIRNDPAGFTVRHAGKPAKPRMTPILQKAGAVIVQASPRADGNSGTLAQWAEEAVQGCGMDAAVIYPHDMDIRECIGCYQCFNTGTCTFDDDMTAVIDAVARCRLLVICTPVYTNTVPANLKLLIDRFQAYYAAQTLGVAVPAKARGIILSVAGRPGQENFLCIKKVLVPFMHIANIVPSGEVFIDGVDRVRDIREIAGCKERVQDLVAKCLKTQIT